MPRRYSDRNAILRKELKAGIDALERGEFTEISAADLDSVPENLES